MSAEQVRQMELINDFKKVSDRELGKKATFGSLELDRMINDFLNEEDC